MSLINVSIFSKEDRITRCHPYERCFWECPLQNCGSWWHLYNITKGQPLPDGVILDKNTFLIMYKRGIHKLANFYENIKERIE